MEDVGSIQDKRLRDRMFCLLFSHKSPRRMWVEYPQRIWYGIYNDVHTLVQSSLCCFGSPGGACSFSSTTHGQKRLEFHRGLYRTPFVSKRISVQHCTTKTLERSILNLPEMKLKQVFVLVLIKCLQSTIYALPIKFKKYTNQPHQQQQQ